MDKKLIFAQGYYKYYKASLPAGMPNSGNENFEKLLSFIGEHKPYKDRNPIGSAYVAIKKKTNGLLGVNWWNPVIKTSNKEIASIRFFYETPDSALYVKIPYKIDYIFKAIALVVDEIKTAGAEIPLTLQPLIDKTYLLAFYNPHRSAYILNKDSIDINHEAQKALIDDFESPVGALNQIFK